MNVTAPAPQQFVQQTNTVSWFSDPIVNGTFLSSATFEVSVTCAGGLIRPMQVRLSSTDASGGAEQLLGEVAVAHQQCQTLSVKVPVATPVTIAQRRLKLTFASAAPVVRITLGPQTFLQGTRFVGAP